MNNQLPDVDTLIKMAKEDPEGLEQLRQKLCTQLIDNAPKQYQRRLNGIQFQIDMTRRKSANELHSCIKISEMMLESYQKLQMVLTDLQDSEVSTKQLGHQTGSSADVIDLKLALDKN